MIETMKNFSLGYESALGVSASIILGYFAVLGIFKMAKYRSRALFLTSPFFITISVIFMVSYYLGISIYLDRQLIPVSIFYYILIAAGVMLSNSEVTKKAVIAMIILFSIFSLKEYYVKSLPSSKKPFKPLVEFINNNKKEGDLFIFGTEVVAAPLGSYYFKDIDFLTYRDTMRSDKGKDLFIDYKGRKIERVWSFTGCWKRDGSRDYASKDTLRLLSGYGVIVESKVFDGIFVDLFRLDKRRGP